MADYGTIGTQYGGRQYAAAYSPCAALVIRAEQPRVATLVDGRKALVPDRYVSGTVKQDSTLVARLVRVYNRSTGELLGSTTSSAIDGSFHCPVGPFTGQVFVIAFDDTGTAPDYNAAVCDLVTPL